MLPDLMAFHDYNAEQSVALDVISQTFTILSIISLASTFSILLILRSLKMKRAFITQNLCITLMISYFMILLSLDKRFIGLDEVTCATMGILLHYMLLVSFMWMFFDGYFFYRISVNALNSWTIKRTIYCIIIAYTVPILIVVVTILTANSLDSRPYNNETSDFNRTKIMQAYSGEEICWLVGDWVWAFNAPVGIIIVANCFFLATGIRRFCKVVAKFQKGMILGVISLTFLFGISWIFGFLLFTEWIAFAYIFATVTGLQGVAICIERCILNYKIRTALIDLFKLFPKCLSDKKLDPDIQLNSHEDGLQESNSEDFSQEFPMRENSFSTRGVF